MSRPDADPDEATGVGMGASGDESDAHDLAGIGPEGWVGIALAAAILVVMGLGVFFRYVLNDSLGWSEELARYGLVYMTFLGCAAAVRRDSHIRVAVMETFLPARALRWLRPAQQIATLAFCAYIAIKAVEISGILKSTPSAAMQIPMSYVYAAIIIGFGLTSLRLIQVIVRDVRR